MLHCGDGWESVVILRWETVSCRVKLRLTGGIHRSSAGRVNQDEGLCRGAVRLVLSGIICACLGKDLCTDDACAHNPHAREVVGNIQYTNPNTNKKKKSFWVPFEIDWRRNGLEFRVLTGIQMQKRRQKCSSVLYQNDRGS